MHNMVDVGAGQVGVDFHCFICSTISTSSTAVVKYMYVCAEYCSCHIRENTLHL